MGQAFSTWTSMNDFKHSLVKAADALLEAADRHPLVGAMDAAQVFRADRKRHPTVARYSSAAEVTAVTCARREHWSNDIVRFASRMPSQCSEFLSLKIGRISGMRVARQLSNLYAVFGKLAANHLPHFAQVRARQKTNVQHCSGLTWD